MSEFSFVGLVVLVLLLRLERRSSPWELSSSESDNWSDNEIDLMPVKASEAPAPVGVDDCLRKRTILESTFNREMELCVDVAKWNEVFFLRMFSFN